jgi:hypothetical protein
MAMTLKNLIKARTGMNIIFTYSRAALVFSLGEFLEAISLK